MKTLWAALAAMVVITVIAAFALSSLDDASTNVFSAPETTRPPTPAD